MLTYSTRCIYNIHIVKQVDNLKQLNNLSYFDIEAISQVTGVSDNNLYKNTNRWVKQSLLIQLKRGLYVTTTYYNNLSNTNSYLEFISNKLRYPSYLSLEYVLTKYQILSESVFTYTSITQKTTRAYNNNLGNFTYRNISNSLFTGYTLETKEGFKIAIASKSKALFDYLYLKLYRNNNISKELLNSFRLNLEEFTENDIEEFKSYCVLSDIAKYKTLPKLLFKNNDN